MTAKYNVALALLALLGCSPSRVILSFEDTGDTSTGDGDPSTSSDGDGDGDGDPSSTGDGDGPLLDLQPDEPEPDPGTCPWGTWGYLTDSGVTELLGPLYHDGAVYFGEWEQPENDPDGTRTWKRLGPNSNPELTLIHASSGSLGHSMVVDDQYIYVSALGRNPDLIALEDGLLESVPAPPGLTPNSSEMALVAGSLYWLNQSAGESSLIRTELGAMSSAVLIDEPLGEQLAGSEEGGLFALRPAGKSTGILQIDPISGDAVELTSVPVEAGSITELLAFDHGIDAVYVVYTSAQTAQIIRVAYDGTTTTVVDPGSYELITHPVGFHGMLYFEFADPGFGWGRVGLDGGEVEVLGPEPDWSPQRWQPMSTSEDCLFVRISYEPPVNFPLQTTLFEIWGGE